ANVIAYRRNVDKLKKDSERLGIEAAKSLEDLLSRSELVTLHVPYDSSTHHLINDSNIRLMTRTSYLINTSRAWIIEGKALLAALNDGRLEGVAIDVHYNEPPCEDWEWKLIRHPRVIATPHIGAQTKEANERIVRQLAEKIIAEFAEA
ncbi:MAG: NAD(P)-dependent oxidoreductase, partial [Thermofilaceae archaeon]